MSAEWISAAAALLTAIVICATAIAAVVQLRHMRAGNAIDAILSFREMLEDEEHRNATKILRTGDLNRALDEPEFRRYLYRSTKRLLVENVPARYLDLQQAAIAMGNSFELIGGMVRNKIVPAHIFLPNYWWVVDNNWISLQKYIAMMREYSGSGGLFEDFEYLTVCSREWARRHPESYAHGVARIPLVNPYPLDQQPWRDET